MARPCRRPRLARFARALAWCCWPRASAPAAASTCSAKRTTLPPDEPADRLYNEGLYLLNAKKDPKEAAKKFEEVDRQHPYSEWARKSLIMTAYAYYQAGEYDDCVTAAKRYITLHPGSPDAAYAQFLIGSSYFDEIPDITRDQARTEKALAALEEVVRKYPNSEYAVSAKQKIEVARDQLAGKEMEIGRYYLEQEGLHRRHQPLQGRGHQVPDHAPRRRSADAADRSLYGARHRRRKRRPRPPCSGTISRTAPGTSTPMRW